MADSYPVTSHVLVRLVVADWCRYKSFAMAKIVRDKISRKTKGYGFVSLLDPHDAARAIREMNGALHAAR